MVMSSDIELLARYARTAGCPFSFSRNSARTAESFANFDHAKKRRQMKLTRLPSLGGRMKHVVMILVGIGILAIVGGAQQQATKSLTGTVVNTEKGMYKWGGIYVKSGSKTYWVYTFCGENTTYCSPKVIGNVEQTGRRVRVFYTRIAPSEMNTDGEIRATKIVALKK
jgi:hypothetical protein